MAIEPLYIDKDLLISRLRMTETSDTDTLTIIDQAIADSRQEFYRRLTLERALEIKAISTVENPITAEDNLRVIADNTDFYQVLSKLLCILPTMFIETAHAIQNTFKDVPITRDSRFLSQFQECLINNIEIGLGQLIEPANNSAGSPRVFDVGRSDPFLIGSAHPGHGFGTI